MVKFEGRSAHEIAMGSGLLCEWLGVLLLSKGVVTADELSAVAHGAEGAASTSRTASSPGAITVIREIARTWENASAKPQT